MQPSFTLKQILIAGLAGAIAFEAYAWLISPPIFGPSLQPANLVSALSGIYLGLPLPYWAGFIGHLLIGVVGFPCFIALVNRVTKTNPVVSGAIGGFILWFVAQGMLAPAVGRSFMMGFGAYTQSSFVAHVGMSLVIGYVFLRLRAGVQTAKAEQPAE